jgi:hypothetical protein
MSSAIKNKRAWIEVAIWLASILVVVLIRVIYYANAHGLSSSWMDNAWIVPAIVSLYKLIYALAHLEEGSYGRLAFNCGAWTLVVYLLLEGVYEMASSYNAGTVYFLYISLVLLGVGLILSLVNAIKEKALASKSVPQ